MFIKHLLCPRHCDAAVNKTEVSTLMEYTKWKQTCKGCVPQMVLSAKGKDEVRWGRGRGKIRSRR